MGELQLATFSSIANTFLVIALAVSLSGCANDASPADDNDEQRQPVASEALITANPEAKLAKIEVDVDTVPAPAPIIQPTPEPVIPPIKAAAKAPLKAPAPAKAPPVAPSPPKPLPKPAAAPVGNLAWVNATMAKYGVYAPAGTKFVFGAMPAGCSGADGCTEYSYYANGVPFDITITIRPGQLTEYLLFHEIGHARGIDGECAADNFARSVLGPVQGHYC